jgi:hypothetical protein
MGHKIEQNQEVLVSMGSKSKGTLDNLVKGEEEHEINHENATQYCNKSKLP